MAVDYLTIDFIVLVLNRSILNPFVAWMIPLCLRAVATQFHDPAFISSCAFAAFLTLAAVFSGVNRRIAHGAPRPVNWEDEVVVITGGASGLGKVLAETYGMRGASVAVLDVRVPTAVELEGEAWQSVRWFRCDVGSVEDVKRARLEVEKNLGTCTILINNAGIANGKPLLELSAAEVEANFRVNLLSHFNTIRTFLPGMLQRGRSSDAAEEEDSQDGSDTDAPPRPRSVGGTIVTVASVLGKIPPAFLTDYAAAKAGLIAMHNSLRSELSSSAPEVKLVLVTPGQLSTPLFASVVTPSNFFGPVVEPVDLAREIVAVVDAGEGGDISLPFYTRYIEWVAVLPASAQVMVRWIAGVDAAMEKAHAARTKAAKKVR